MPSLARVIGNVGNQKTDEWGSAVLIRTFNIIANSQVLSKVSVSNNIITSSMYCKNCKTGTSVSLTCI